MWLVKEMLEAVVLFVQLARQRELSDSIGHSRPLSRIRLCTHNMGLLAVFVRYQLHSVLLVHL